MRRDHLALIENLAARRFFALEAGAVPPTPARPARAAGLPRLRASSPTRSTSVTAVSTATRHQPRELHAHVVTTICIEKSGPKS